MKPKRTAAWGGLCLGLLALVSTFLTKRFALDRHAPPTGTVILTDWQAGQRTYRRVLSADDSHALAMIAAPNVQRILEDIVDEKPILGRSKLLFGASFAPAKDGVKVRYRDRSAVLTPDDLQLLHAYDVAFELGRSAKLMLGLDRDIVLSALAGTLQCPSHELLAEGQFTRIAVRRRAPSLPPAPELTPKALERAIVLGARYLANQLKADGTFRYELDPFTGEVTPGYSWPRHAGATFYLAQAAGLADDPFLKQKARQAASTMTQSVSRRCGSRRCVGDGDEVNVGSSALALLAFVELVQTRIAPQWSGVVRELADFLRSQQRPDGEFMHLFDLKRGRAIDKQQAYYTGEAAFALARAHRITKDPRDLLAATRALDYLVYRPAWAPGMRYIWTAEHWTCQAMAELWDRAPNRDALDFCLDWYDYDRAVTSRDEIFGGVIGGGPYQAVRYTGSASRMEAAVATLSVARQAGVSPSRLRDFETGVRGTLRLLLRTQFDPGLAHLMRPSAGDYLGGVPGGNVDFHVRIDYPQHAGAAWLRYLELLRATGRG